MIRQWFAVLTITLSFPAAVIPAAQATDVKDSASRTDERDTIMDANSYLSYPFVTITGDTASLSEFAGRVVLLVNVASECGYTRQYAGLEKLYRTYKDKGLVVIGFPANNFGGQEPGTDEEILQFCSTKFDVTFPMMSKVSVKGSDKHPLFVYLTEQSPIPGEIAWNFSKFLLDKQGKLIARYPSQVEPMDKEVVSKIETLLQ